MTNMTRDVTAMGDKHCFTVKPGLKAATVSVVIGCVSLALFVFAIGLFLENAAHWPKSTGLAAVGSLIALWCIYEVRGFLYVDRYFTDRIERTRGNTVAQSIVFADGFKFSYAVRADGADRLLAIDGKRKASFVILTTRKPGQSPTSAEPSVEQVESYCDWLAQLVEERITSKLERSESVRLAGPFTLAPAGLGVDGRIVPWSEIEIDVDDSTGDVAFTTAGVALGSFSMMDDNALGALRVLRRLVGAPR